MTQQQEVERQEVGAPEGAMPEANRINGIDTSEVLAMIDAIKADPSKSSCAFSATTRWRHGTLSECEISKYVLGGEEIPQHYSIAVDEPSALLGTDSAPNPQMFLFAAINSCVLNSFVVNAAMKGIHVDSLEVGLDGNLDLRGFLGLDENINPGYDELRIVCRVKADATREQLQECLDAATHYSPNFQSLSRPVDVKYGLELV